MDPHFQSLPLLECPSFPNSVIWSEENLVAVASGSIVTILNPAVTSGPRGLIKLRHSTPFPIGVVKEEDLSSPTLMPISLSCDPSPSARSISWSPVGCAPNSGCLLAVCSIDGHVKIYRSPYCEYSIEWVEVVDISESLFDYFVKTKFSTPFSSSDSVNQEKINENVVWKDGGHVIDDVSMHPVGLKRKRKKTCSVSTMEQNHPLITARQYASRSAMLSSLVVAWSSVLESMFGSFASSKYAILAVGGKSGIVSFWRFQLPECFTIEHGKVSLGSKLIGVLQAHSAWVTVICWEKFIDSSSESIVALATGSSDGSVNLWVAEKRALITSQVDFTPFRLLKEVLTATGIPVSTLSMDVLAKFPDNIILAVGKGSGSLEVWLCHILSGESCRIQVCDAHDRVVTGLSWAFDGCSLYSCGQDSLIRSWNLNVDSLDDIHSNPPKLQESRTVAQLFDPSLGLALSPGHLMIAVVRRLDSDLLNPMYQARTQKASVEFFWIGDQPMNNKSRIRLDFIHNVEESSSLLIGNLSSWKSNILWSLKQYDNIGKPLALWDILAALLAIRQTIPTFVEHLLLNWFFHWSLPVSLGNPLAKILSVVRASLSKFSIRQIHLLNIICRRLLLLLGDISNDGVVDNTDVNEFLTHSEKELRSRLVSFSLKSIFFLASCGSEVPVDSKKWLPTGVAQMKQWVTINKGLVDDQLLLLISKVDQLGSRIKCICESQATEVCAFCFALVPFESPEVALCKATKCTKGSFEIHKFRRCAASMKLCSVTSLLWFCICCQRWTSTLVPGAFFTMYDPAMEGGYAIDSLDIFDDTSPLCPFCGILLQRCAPNFLLAANPV